MPLVAKHWNCKDKQIPCPRDTHSLQGRWPSKRRVLIPGRIWVLRGKNQSVLIPCVASFLYSARNSVGAQWAWVKSFFEKYPWPSKGHAVEAQGEIMLKFWVGVSWEGLIEQWDVHQVLDKVGVSRRAGPVGWRKHSTKAWSHDSAYEVTVTTEQPSWATALVRGGLNMIWVPLWNTWLGSGFY